MMTLSALAQSAGGSAPLDPTEVLAMSVSDLSIGELVSRVHGLIQLQEAGGMLRAKYLREIRDRDYPITGQTDGKGNVNTRTGWAGFLKAEFGGRLTVKACDAEIRGLESLEAAAKAISASKTAENPGKPVNQVKPVQISNTLLMELGMANGCGPQVAERILTGEISGKRQVAQAVKEAKAAAKLAGIKDVQPVKPKAAPRPIPAGSLQIAPPEGGVTYSLKDYRNSPRAAEQREFFEKQLEKMRKAAVAYRNTVKQLEDYTSKGKADDRRFPSHMTVMSMVWKEGGFDLDKTFDEVADELAEATRLWGLAVEATHGAAQIVD